eukprot:12283-Eustigmatos_ZCMA.PRE.1
MVRQISGYHQEALMVLDTYVISKLRQKQLGSCGDGMFVVLRFHVRARCESYGRVRLTIRRDIRPLALTG